MPDPPSPAPRPTILLAALACLVAATSAPALARPGAGGPPAASDSTGRSYVSEELEGAAPEIDGRLADPIWREATFTSGFRQRDPAEGEPARQPTEVAIRHDSEHLYLAARMHRRRPGAIRRQVTRRDEAGTSPVLYLHLDPERDRRTAKVFGVTAAGVRVDYFLSNDRGGSGGGDFTFDPVWRVEVRVDSTGWTAEVRIPFSELRLSGTDRTDWGLQLVRQVPVRNEVDHWTLVPKTREGWASRFGRLRGLSGIDRSRPLEARPYVAVQGDRSGDVPDEHPLRSRTEGQLRAGGELSAGLGSGLSLDMTVNPDFGQVEADPARLNLSAYETFFREHRPFFTEGSQFLRSDGPDYFYSRRIGAPPHGRPSGRFVDVPSTTTILGAAKLTGRVDGDLSVGGLGAVTQEERALVVDSVGGSVRSEKVEPRTAYGVGRVEEELGAGSTVGLSLTGVRRDLDAGGSLAGRLPRSSMAGGGDWTLWFGDGRYEASGYAGLSHASGVEEAIERLQRSSVRFFQRPDADHVSVDPARTSLTGWTGGLELRKRSGEHWLWNVEARAVSPGFAINDLGRLRAADRTSVHGELTYRQTDPGPLLRRWRLDVDAHTQWNFGGTRRFSGVGPSALVEWPNYMQTRLRFFYFQGGLDDRKTRGGPVVDRTDRWSFVVRHRTNPRDPERFDATFFHRRSGLGGWSSTVQLGASVRPSPDLRLEFRPRLSLEEEPRQYVSALPDGPSATYGRRYVFSRLDRTTLATELRADYAFTPDLSLELFAQPFAARGDYRKFGELERPGDRELLRYGEDGSRIVERRDRALVVESGGDRFTVPEPDFNLFSFRSTAVLRWQWQPGSTFYLAWQQNRRERRATGSPVGLGGWAEPFGVPGDQVVTAKMSYWLPL